MSNADTNTASPHLSLPERDPGTPALAASPVPTAALPRSGDPREVFAGLVHLLDQLGFVCLVALVEDDAAPYEIDSWGPGARPAAWAQMSVVLEAEAPVLCNGKVVGVRFHSAVPDAAPASFFLGGLVAYRRRGRRMGSDEVQLVGSLVDQAVALVLAERARAELAAQRERVDQLERALGSNREIGVAIGIIMARERCSADEAFDRLRTVSQYRNLKLREVAAQVAYTGALSSPM